AYDGGRPVAPNNWTSARLRKHGDAGGRRRDAAGWTGNELRSVPAEAGTHINRRQPHQLYLLPFVPSNEIGPMRDEPAFGPGACAGRGMLSCCVERRISFIATRT